MTGTPGPKTISTKTEWIAALAKQIRDKPLTSLSQHIDVAWLREAYERTRRDGAAGIDGQTMAEYGAELEKNLEQLLDRAKSGQYRAPPVRRVHIPKGDGRKTRPIGIPTAEDKVLQRAVVMVLEPVYEQEFLDCSYGFRRGRSAHQALEELWTKTMNLRGGWMLEADIEGFFDAVDHGWLREMLQRRVEQQETVSEAARPQTPTTASSATRPRSQRSRTGRSSSGASGWGGATIAASAGKPSTAC